VRIYANCLCVPAAHAVSRADNHTDADYIAFVDTDTLFITVMTYEVLFDDAGRPRVSGAMGPPADQHWANISENTALWFGEPEVFRAMFYFPVRSGTLRTWRVPMAVSTHLAHRPWTDELFVLAGR
jgi:hypothetical protein